MASASEYLRDRGYKVETRKGSRAFSLNVSSAEDRLTIEAPKRNQKNVESHLLRLEREFDNSRKKVIEGRNSTYQVVSAEDIVLPKLVRTIGALERSPYLGGSLPAELEPLSDEWIAKRLKKIGDLREEAMYKPGDIDLAQQVRLVSDVYDMRVLAEIVGLNESYWNKAEKDWDVIQRNPKLKERILGVILPDFAHY